jgi:PTS system nitrogen regulatory IIA component
LSSMAGERVEMNLLKYITSEQILLQIEVTDQHDLFKQMIHAMASENYLKKNPQLTEDSILQAILSRETQRPTNIGRGMALPHGRMANVETLGLSVATLKKPVVFSPDTDPVNLLFMVLPPTNKPNICLQVMAGMLRHFTSDEERAKFLKLTSPDEAYQLLTNVNLRIDCPIYARDIMRAPGFYVHPETSVKNVARLMFEEHLDVLPVLDHEKHIVGEITTNRLFRFGLPEFFQKLQSVSFIAEFDPFEKYFEVETKSESSDLMSEEFCTVPPEYTMLEIIFSLAVKRFPQLYITDEQKHWIGTIDRSTVLDKVINF